MKRVILAIVASLGLLGSTAYAGDTLEYPVSVDLKVGTSPDDSAAAVAALDSDSDGDDYVVTNELVGRDQLYTVIYVVRFAIDRADQLTLQLDAQTDIGSCTLGLDLYKWSKRKWKKTSAGTVTSSTTDPFSSDGVSARSYVRNGKVLGRIRCTDSAALAHLTSNRVRLITGP